MNKKMREILAKITDSRAKARAKQDAGDIQGATDILDQIDTLQAEYDNEKRLYEAERNAVPDDPKSQDKASGFIAKVKMAFRKKLTDAEDALITGGTDGENYLVPEDVNNEIREVRKTYVAAKDYVNVVPVTTLSGSNVYEEGTPSGLSDFTDGSDLDEETNPSFTTKPWAIKFFGKIFPISRILLGAEKAGLMSYLNRWFVKNAIITENTKIFTALKDGKTAKQIEGLTALASAINTELDPSALIGGVIITNQTGFDGMDTETDQNGRPMLTKDLSEPTMKRYKGLPIVVFPDGQLANTSGKAPIFVGDIKSGIDFMEYQGLQFDVSEHVFFKKNQDAMRVMEGFDVIQSDAAAYFYGLYKKPTAASAGE